MTQDEIHKMEEKVRKDWSLSEERKTELLQLLTMMKPERTKSFKSPTEEAQSNIQIKINRRL
jgi:hypothetical protein